MGARLIRTRHFTPASASPDDTWRLLRWCVEHGASEFSVRVMCEAGEPAPTADRFEDTFAPALVGEERRHVLSHPVGEDRPTIRLWRLDDRTEALLHPYLPQGLFTNAVDPRGWIEDPLVYRNGELMLGVVTHERDGVLRATADEMRELDALGFVFGQ
ncbi:MAG TPA: hypothetical protein VF041_00030 [Gemmatimonadaceae bacterium]